MRRLLCFFTLFTITSVSVQGQVFSPHSDYALPFYQSDQFDTGEALLALCKDINTRELCGAYIYGNHNGYRRAIIEPFLARARLMDNASNLSNTEKLKKANKMLEEALSSNRLCVPFAINDQIYKVVRYLESNPDNLRLHSSTIIERALKESSKCSE